MISRSEEMKMAMQISRAQVEKLKNRYQSMQSRMRNLREKADEAVGSLVQTVEIGSIAFGMGLVNGRFRDPQGNPGIEFLGIPLDLGLALGAHGFAYIAGGQYREHMHNLGDGLLAAYLTSLGMGVGTKMWEKAENRLAPGSAPSALPSGAASQGFARTVGAEPLTDAELAVLANA